MSYPMPARQGERASTGEWAHPIHALMSLDPDGIIVDCDPEASELFGYIPNEVEGRHISFLLPELARLPLLKNGAVNPRLAFLCHCGKHFTGCRREGWSFQVELFVNRVEAASEHPLLLMVRAAETPIAQDTAGSQAKHLLDS